MSRLHATLPLAFKKIVWNVKYDVLSYPRWNAPHDVVENLSSQLLKDKSLLDLGCGRGSLLHALREAGWRGSYCGVDISAAAIRVGMRLGDQRSTWTASDFESFRSPFTWNTIAMVESLCYVNPNEIDEFLHDTMAMIEDGGRLVVRLHDFDKHRFYIDALTRNFGHADINCRPVISVAKISGGGDRSPATLHRRV